MRIWPSARRVVGCPTTSLVGRCEGLKFQDIPVRRSHPATAAGHMQMYEPMGSYICLLPQARRPRSGSENQRCGCMCCSRMHARATEGPTDSAALFAWKPATHRVPRPVKTEAPKVAPNTNPDLGARVGHVSRLRTRLAECFSDESEVGKRGFQFLDDFSSHNGRRRRFSTSSSDSSRSQKMSRLALSRSSSSQGGKSCAYPTPMMGCVVALHAPSSRLPGRDGQRSEVSALVG